MNYTNYEDNIVQGRKVRIIGWPTSIAFASPSTIGNLKDMRTLHDGWMVGSIRWVRMSSADVKEHAEDLQQRRDEGQTIGKKRKRRSAGKKEKTPTTSKCRDDDSSVCSDNGENTAPAPKSSRQTRGAQRAKRTPKLRMPPTSKTMISDSDEGEGEEDEGVTRDENASR
jgi:hypothetical protein